MATPTSVAGVGEPMIIVHINDRLGTKAAIPCLASDPIGRAITVKPLWKFLADRL